LKAGGGGGGGGAFLGADTGTLTYAGIVNALGGMSPNGDGGDGLLTLTAADLADVLIQPGALINGAAPLSLGSASTFIADMSLSDYLPAGGAGGGGAGGPGLPIPEPSFSALLGTGFGIMWLLRKRKANGTDF
jgi:hypothetical protein